MAALALRQDFHTRYYFRLDAGVTEKETDLDPVLNPLAAQSRSDTAVVYRFHQESSEFSAVAARSAIRPLVRDAGVTQTPGVSGWVFGLTDATQGTASEDERFERFPERLQYGVDSLLAVPLRNAERLLGLLTLGRRSAEAFGPEVLPSAQRTGRLISAVMERDELEQRLRERKIVERAKGILQERRGLSEERAYLLLRSTSRRRRLPMFDVAREIVDYARPVPARFSASAR